MGKKENRMIKRRTGKTLQTHFPTDVSDLFTLMMKMPLNGKLYALCLLPKHSLNGLINITLASTLHICRIRKDERSFNILEHVQIWFTY